MEEELNARSGHLYTYNKIPDIIKLDDSYTTFKNKLCILFIS